MCPLIYWLNRESELNEATEASHCAYRGWPLWTGARVRGVHSGEGGVFGEWRAGSAKALKVEAQLSQSVTGDHRALP